MSKGKPVSTVPHLYVQVSAKRYVDGEDRELLLAGIRWLAHQGCTGPAEKLARAVVSEAERRLEKLQAEVERYEALTQEPGRMLKDGDDLLWQLDYWRREIGEVEARRNAVLEWLRHVDPTTPPWNQEAP